MKTMCKALILAAVSGLGTASALHASDTNASHQSPTSWTGFYVGAGGGIGLVNSEVSGGGHSAATIGAGENFAFNPDANALEINACQSNCDVVLTKAVEAKRGVIAEELGGAGGLGYIQTGYDHQLGRVVIGAFADFDWGKSKSNVTSHAAVGGVHGSRYDVSLPGVAPESRALMYEVHNSTNLAIETKRSWTLGGRVGFTPTNRTLIYVGAGYSRMDADVVARTQTRLTDPQSVLYDSTGEQGSDQPAVLVGSHSRKDYNLETFKGYTLLAGMETALWDNLFLKAEYRYARFQEETSRWEQSEGEIGDEGLKVQGGEVRIQPQSHSARVGLSYKFGAHQAYRQKPEPIK